MNFFKVVPVSLIALLAACESGTSPDSSNTNNSSNNGSNNGASIPSSFTQGELQYERHFDKESIASMKCNVYSTNNTVSLDLKYFILAESNAMTEKLYVKYGNPSNYNAEMEVSGLMQMAASSACAKLKEGAASVENAVISCDENSAVLTATLPSVSDADVARMVPPTIEQFKTMCDESYVKFSDMTEEMLAEMNVSEEPKEGTQKALSCNVQTNGNTILLNVAFPGISVLFKMEQKNDAYYLTEEYSGVDEATLSNVCAAYKTEEEIENVNCAGSVITYTSTAFTSNGASLDASSVASFIESIECPALLNGTMTLEDLWYQD